MREIQLTRGRVAIVDDVDFETLIAFKWRFSEVRGSGRGYAVRSLPRTAERPHGGDVSMHCQLLPVAPGLRVDHADGDGLNNRRHNLRPVTQQQNSFNRKVSCRNSSGFTGVSFDKSSGKWLGYIRVNGRLIRLGLYEKLEDAAAARAKAEPVYFGEFAGGLRATC